MRKLLDLVEPHSVNLEAAADAMVRAGIGADPTNGHAVVLRRMAADIRADAARGRVAGSFSAANPGHVDITPEVGLLLRQLNLSPPPKNYAIPAAAISAALNGRGVQERLEIKALLRMHRIIN